MKVYEVLPVCSCAFGHERFCLRASSEDVISYLSLYVSIPPGMLRLFESHLGPDEFEVPF
jgi:hypothetical protein